MTSVTLPRQQAGLAIALASLALLISAPPAAAAALGAAGGLALLAGFHADGRRRLLFLLIAGLALGGWRGIEETRRRIDLDVLVENPSPVALRVDMTILEGWSTSRWGHTTKVRVHDASHASRAVDLPRRCRLEVRTSAPNVNLPRPGTQIGALVSIRGDSKNPLLVAASSDLLQALKAPRGAPAVREYLAESLVKAAGTDPGRIRSAELAAALALGRRDLVPTHRRQGWRATGRGPAQAGSGLNVGMV